MKVIPLVLHAVQIIFSAVALGLSISLVKGQIKGSSPPQQGYAAFAGAFGCVVGIVGLVVTFKEFLTGIVMAAIDGLAAVVLFAAGVVSAIPFPAISNG